MKKIRETCPALKGKIVTQDIAEVIDTIPEGFLPAELDIHPQVADFWQEQQLKNAGVYYLRRIMHDWSDNECRKILQNVANAMGTDSELLIAEVCVPDQVQRDDAMHVAKTTVRSYIISLRKIEHGLC